MYHFNFFFITIMSLFILIYKSELKYLISNGLLLFIINVDVFFNFNIIEMTYEKTIKHKILI